MTWKNLCLASMLIVACHGRLTVDEQNPGGGAAGGAGFSAGDGGGGVAPDAQAEAGEATPGARCIPGGSAIEAQGTVARAEVVTLDRCDDGLTCSADGICVPIPDCPSTTPVCIVRRAIPNAGNEGAGPTNRAGGAGGVGGSNIDGGLAGPESGVLAMTADDANLYWVEYGTRDSLGNYQNDGALMALNIVQGLTSTLAASLPGPTDLGVTTRHVYVYVDGAPLIGSPTHPQLLRIPLSGGAPELVQDGTIPRSFAASAERAFWTSSSAIYAISGDAAAVPSIFLGQGFYEQVAADASHLYYLDYHYAPTVWRAPLDGSSPEPVISPAYPFALRGSAIDGVEDVNNGTGVMLDEMPKEGGSWQRVQALGAGNVAGKFQIAGDRLFFDSNPPQVGPYVQADGNRINVVTASFGPSARPIRLLERATLHTYIDHLWLGTANAFYWSDGRAIYQRKLDGLH